MTYEELTKELAKFPLKLSDENQKKLHVYASLLKEWNEKMNLTSIVEEGEVIEKHFYDSLLLAKYFDFSGKKVADIGSGAGFPGMVIAIFFPTAQVTLIDSTKKKFQFLEEVKKELSLDNVSFYEGRAEEMEKEKGSFDVVTSRGFSAMNIFMEVGAPLLKKGGTLIAMKSRKGEEELADSRKAMHELGLALAKKGEDPLPSGELRLNYFFFKKKDTPSRYPRPWAEIVKKPL